MQEANDNVKETNEEVKDETNKPCEECGESCANDAQESVKATEHKEEGKKKRFGKKDKSSELEEEIIKLKEELATSKNAYYKVFADTENLKKRLQSEADTMRKYRIQGFAGEILPILDSLDRALDVQIDDQNIKNYVKGFEMIHKQLIAVLEKEGVSEIEALDKPFDPNIHQALMQEAREGVESGIVLEVLQKGYMLKDRVLRATLVKVSE